MSNPDVAAAMALGSSGARVLLSGVGGLLAVLSPVVCVTVAVGSAMGSTTAFRPALAAAALGCLRSRVCHRPARHVRVVHDGARTTVAFGGLHFPVGAVLVLPFGMRTVEVGTARVGVNAAWWHVYRGLSDAVFSALGRRRRVVVVGYSIGGALAVYFALEARARGHAVEAVYTFGSPRPGDKALARVAGATLRHHRVVNSRDPVPWLPPPPFVQTGAARVFSDGLFLPQSHSINTYQRNIWRTAAAPTPPTAARRRGASA